MMRAVVKGVLEGEGHEVITAEGGKEALRYANEQSVGLVMTDPPIPNMNGTRLVHRLRLLGYYQATPILMLTTDGAQEKKKKARNRGPVAG